MKASGTGLVQKRSLAQAERHRKSAYYLLTKYHVNVYKGCGYNGIIEDGRQQTLEIHFHIPAPERA